ncbi:MAG TPA: glycerol kinase GlpK, partial [Hymenobacter sp.]|nr:glycerol kinase GlpK [Hymenobacter sp.]
ILDHVQGARRQAEAGELAFGTVDSWLVWNFTQGELHVTDVTNASRTMLFNIHSLTWDDELLALFDIPRSMLPEVRQSSEVYGETKTTVFASKIPIAGIAGDQQAALFGQLCTAPGMVKSTYGTGCFMLMNIGPEPRPSQNNLLTTVAWKIDGQVQYALEGSIFVAGAVVQWLRDNLGIIKTASEIEQLAKQVSSTDGVYFVPAFAGLGAPYWDPYARGTIFGLSRATTAAHIARAAVEAIAYQTMDVLRAIEADSGLPIAELRVDGGAAANNLLMQFLADVLNTNVVRPRLIETTALGAAYLAGLAVGYWPSLGEIKALNQTDTTFSPQESRADTEAGILNWQRAVRALQQWSKDVGHSV